MCPDPRGRKDFPLLHVRGKELLLEQVPGSEPMPQAGSHLCDLEQVTWPRTLSLRVPKMGPTVLAAQGRGLAQHWAHGPAFLVAKLASSPYLLSSQRKDRLWPSPRLGWVPPPISLCPIWSLTPRHPLQPVTGHYFRSTCS